MAASPTVSVVIPCYNGARFLRETLASVSAQTHPALEVLVVDDGSTDESAAVAGAFGPPVRVIRQPNQGESVARNRGVDEATGDWVAFLDADDLWEPAKLAKQLAAVGDGPRACCTGAYFFTDDPGRPTAEWVPRPEHFDRRRLYQCLTPCHVSGLLVRRELPARFPTWTRYAEDLIYLGDLLAFGPVAIVPERLVGYRQHAAAQSRRPDVWVHWQQSVEGWVRRSQVPAAEEAEAVRASLSALAAECAVRFRRRDWVGYDALRGYLLSRTDQPGVADPVPTRGLPRWAYPVRDWAARWARQPRRAAASFIRRLGRR